MEKMYYSSDTDFLSVRANVYAPKSWEPTSPGFDPVTPLSGFLNVTHGSVFLLKETKKVFSCPKF